MGNNFSKNLKYLRERNKISQNKMSELVGVNQTTIGRWETEEMTPSIDNVEEVARVLKVPLPDLLIKDLSFDNAELVEINTDTVSIPVLGTIRAGMPMEAQEEIIDYVDIPREWTKGGKQFFGLKIKGNSMSPKYTPGDTVVFEQTNDIEYANNKDACVMVNGFDATFKKFNINQSGVTLTPLNLENEDGYTTTFYDIEQVQGLPVKVIGIARRKISDIE